MTDYKQAARNLLMKHTESLKKMNSTLMAMAAASPFDGAYWRFNSLARDFRKSVPEARLSGLLTKSGRKHLAQLMSVQDVILFPYGYYVTPLKWQDMAASDCVLLNELAEVFFDTLSAAAELE